MNTVSPYLEREYEGGEGGESTKGVKGEYEGGGGREKRERKGRKREEERGRERFGERKKRREERGLRQEEKRREEKRSRDININVDAIAHSSIHPFMPNACLHPCTPSPNIHLPPIMKDVPASFPTVICIIKPISYNEGRTSSVPNGRLHSKSSLCAVTGRGRNQYEHGTCLCKRGFRGGNIS